MKFLFALCAIAAVHASVTADTADVCETTDTADATKVASATACGLISVKADCTADTTNKCSWVTKTYECVTEVPDSTSVCQTTVGGAATAGAVIAATCATNKVSTNAAATCLAADTATDLVKQSCLDAVASEGACNGVADTPCTWTAEVVDADYNAANTACTNAATNDDGTLCGNADASCVFTAGYTIAAADAATTACAAADDETKCGEVANVNACEWKTTDNTVALGAQTVAKAICNALATKELCTADAVVTASKCAWAASSGGTSIGLIIGIVVGVLVLFVVLAYFMGWFCFSKGGSQV